MDKYVELTRSPHDEGDNEQHDDENPKWFDSLQTTELVESDYDSDGESAKTMEELVTNIDKISEESAEHRTSIEKDFKDIQTRLDTNKNNLDKIKTQIDKVTDVLHKLKTSDMSNVKLRMGDWSKEVEAEMLNEKLLHECNREIGDLENALGEDLKDSTVEY